MLGLVAHALHLQARALMDAGDAMRQKESEVHPIFAVVNHPTVHDVFSTSCPEGLCEASAFDDRNITLSLRNCFVH